MAAPTQSLATSFKQELFQALHDFDVAANTFKLALFAAASTVTGTFNASTTNYSQMTAPNETTGTNYVAGGENLTNIAPTTSGTTAFIDFSDLTFSNVTVTSSGAMIYNSTNGNRNVCLLNFGGDKTATAGDFTIQFPTADASNAIIRLA